MFEIIHESESVGLTDQPNYVRKKDGIWVNCDAEDAEAIAFHGTAYEDAYAREVDGGEFAFNEAIKLEKTTNTLNDTEDALCDVTEDFDQRIADIEDAICELTEV